MPGALVISAIHGLGGIGKSVLAAALAHGPETQAYFTPAAGRLYEWRDYWVEYPAELEPYGTN